MRLVPNTDERDLTLMVRSLFAAHWTGADVRALRAPGADRVPHQLWARLGRAGICAIAVAEEHGGAGGSLTDVGTVAVEAGRALCPSIVLGTMGFGYAVDQLGEETHRARLLPALARGELRGVAVLAGSGDAADLTPPLSATRAGAGWRVSGSVPDVVDADLADLVLATARTQEGSVIGVLLAPHQCVLQPRPTTAGDRRTTLHVDTAVESEAVLGGSSGSSGLAEAELRRVAQALVVLGCLEAVGVTEAILDRTVEHTRTREQFGRPIASFQAAQHLVANMRIALTAARLTSHSAASALADGGVQTRRTAIAVRHAARAARQVSLDAHQLHGGMGYVVETDLHLWSERARELSIVGGGALAATGWLAEALTEQVSHV